MLTRRRLLLISASSCLTLALPGCVSTYDAGELSLTTPPPLPTACPACHGPVVPVDTLIDDALRPSRNLAVWNRSICGNLFFGGSAPYCTACNYAYSPVLSGWMLSSEDRSAFRRSLSPTIATVPLRPGSQVTSRIVYSQRFSGGAWVDSIGLWCIEDAGYLEQLARHAAANDITLSKRHYLSKSGEVYVDLTTRPVTE